MSYFEYLYENANTDLIEYIIEESAYNFTIKSFENDKIEELEILGFIVDCIINEEEIDNGLEQIVLDSFIPFVENTSKIYSSILFETTDNNSSDSLDNNEKKSIWRKIKDGIMYVPRGIGRGLRTVRDGIKNTPGWIGQKAGQGLGWVGRKVGEGVKEGLKKGVSAGVGAATDAAIWGAKEAAEGIANRTLGKDRVERIKDASKITGDAVGKVIDSVVSVPGKVQEAKKNFDQKRENVSSFINHTKNEFNKFKEDMKTSNAGKAAVVLKSMFGRKKK